MSSSPRPFDALIDRPLPPRSRVLLALLVVPLLLSFMAPIWRISMVAPQYPEGLYVDIYAYKLVGGGDGQHLSEINTLNHYIGMHPIDRAAMSDLDWIPFALGALALIALRVALLGKVKNLVDLAVLTTYVSGFAFARFVYRLYLFGHELNPEAPVKVQPFMPAVLGTKQIANFTTSSLPGVGSLLLGAFSLGVVLLCGYHLLSGFFEARALARSRAVQPA